jgi:phosphoribosyl 1,2-cyclic phosphodiesterase
VIRFKSLGSGSTGNACVVEHAGESAARLLVDCGFGYKQLLARLAQADLGPHQLDAIFITHEHGDHIGCAATLALRFQLPIWMSAGTYAAIGSPDLGGLLRIARDGESFEVGSMVASPFTVPHDAREPLQLCCSHGTSRLGILTDLGHATDHVLDNLQACSALLLECNHDADLLAQSAYPEFLKSRVSGPHGHLSNAHAAKIAAAVGHSGLKLVVAAHLSVQNNTPALAYSALSQAVAQSGTRVVLADAGSGCSWAEA